MEIKYIVGGNPFENEEDFIEIFLTKILSEEEIEILKKCNIAYEYLEKEFLKLTVIDYTDYFVELVEEENKIYLDKTEWYYEYIEKVRHMSNKEDAKVLVIVNDGVKIEMIKE